MMKQPHFGSFQLINWEEGTSLGGLRREPLPGSLPAGLALPCEGWGGHPHLCVQETPWNRVTRKGRPPEASHLGSL